MTYRTRSEYANHYTTDNRSKFNLHLIVIAGVSEKSLMEKPSELQIGKIVSQLTFIQLKIVLIHLGFDISEIDKIETDNPKNIQNVMFLCLQEWKQKKLDGTLDDIKNALAEATVNTHILCKVNISACRLLP
jgi:hydrogenase maturation factor